MNKADSELLEGKIKEIEFLRNELSRFRETISRQSLRLQMFDDLKLLLHTSAGHSGPSLVKDFAEKA